MCSLAGHVPVLDACALKLCDLLEAHATGASADEPIDIFRAFGRMTLAVMGECGFG